MTESRLGRLRHREFYADLSRRLLSHRYTPVLLALIGALTVLPAITQDIYGDDLIHRAWLQDQDEVDPRLVEAAKRRRIYANAASGHNQTG